jgi:putative oxidoreductase
MAKTDLALLVVRLGVGLSMLIFHGYQKLVGGPEMWTRVGGAMANLGITFLPTMWGFLAAFSESACSLLLVLGVLTRPAAGMLAFTMLVATLNHLNLPADSPNAGWSGASHALELFSVYLALLIVGPGRYSASRK